MKLTLTQFKLGMTVSEPQYVAHYTLGGRDVGLSVCTFPEASLLILLANFYNLLLIIRLVFKYPQSSGIVNDMT